MGKMRDIWIDVEELLSSTDLSFPEIAKKLDIPVDWVYDIAEQLGEFDE